MLLADKSLKKKVIKTTSARKHGLNKIILISTTQQILYMCNGLWTKQKESKDEGMTNFIMISLFIAKWTLIIKEYKTCNRHVVVCLQLYCFVKVVVIII